MREVGEAVTPAGSPEKVTLTAPVKAFNAVASTCTFEPVCPAIRFNEVGEAVSVKSGPGAATDIARLTVAAWDRVPEVPVSVICAVPATADEVAVKVTF